MKIALCSDLHLEFADIILKNDENADVLILGGDICLAKELPYAIQKKANVIEISFLVVPFNSHM